MASNTVYLSAGLPIPKNADQTPTTNTAYVSAGLPAEPLTGEAPTFIAAWARQKSKVIGGGVA